MDPDSLFFLITFIILIMLSAFFSGSEIAFMTTSKHAISSFVREKRFGAKSLEKIKENTDRLLITILIGNNIVNVATASLTTVVTTQFARNSWLWQEVWVLIATTAVTIVLLLFGEITPKTICTRYNNQISLLIAPIYRVLIFVLMPISILIEFFITLMMKMFGGANFVKKISYQEVEAFIDMSHEEWEVEETERRQMKNLLSLREMFAESVMTPRVNVKFLDAEMTINEACKFFLSHSHSRMPVAGESTDDVDYILTLREAFRFQSQWLWDKKLKDLELEKIMKIPLTQTLDDLFEQFQKSRRHIALVFDEYGWTAGIVTMEDVLEEVFGDIKDEADKEEIFIKKKWNSTIEAVGSVLIDDILEEFEIHSDDLWIKEEYNNETLSYIIMAQMEDFPSVWDEIVFEDENFDKKLVLKVLQIDDNVIEKIECTLKDK